MSINVWTDPMQHAELFGKPVLFTNWLILRDLVPKGWHCYDLQGTQNNPNGHAALVDRENIFHTGTILSPQPLKREGTVSRRVNGSFHLLGEEMTLEQFCEKHDLEYPQDTREFILRPASPDEAGLFYSMDAEEDRVLGTVGHLRIDFGHGGKEFWHTWWPHNDDQFNTPEFKDILQRFVDSLRQDGPLKDLKAMSTYCWQHGGPITEDKRSYGYLVEVGNYCALPGFVDSKNEEKTERNAGYLVVSQSGGGMLRQGTREGIRRTPANRGMRAHRVVKGLDISEDVCHGLCP